ncbi:cytochrome c oxidase subunit 1 [compost metagenome]
MPSASILPFVMSVGIFVAGLGFMYHQYVVVGLGLVVTFACMAIRSLYDDHGWHIDPEETTEKGVKA